MATTPHAFPVLTYRQAWYLRHADRLRRQALARYYATRNTRPAPLARVHRTYSAYHRPSLPLCGQQARQCPLRVTRQAARVTCKACLRQMGRQG